MAPEHDDSGCDDVWFVFDGECPICQLGASLYKVRQSVGQLHTVDARTETDHPVMKEVNAGGYDLDEGMVIKYRDRLYQGADALEIMAELGADENVFTQLHNALFRSPTLAKAAYPFMRGARNLAITLNGAGKIRNLEDSDDDQ